MPSYAGELLGASADPFETDVSLLEARVDALEGAGGVGGVGAPANATYIVQIPNGGLSAEQALSVLATGLLKSTTASGVLSIAVAGVDYLAPDAGLAEIAALSTTPFGRALLTQSDLSALQDVLQISDAGLSGSFGDLLAKPTTIAGYGITDAAAVGGMDTQVQFNDGGVQAGSADLIFSKGPGRLTVFDLLVTNLLTSINTSFQGNTMIGPGGSIIIRPGASITNASSIGVPDEAGTGTATVAPAGTAVVGTGTLFTTEFAVGAAIKLGDQVHAIAAIADNTHLTLSTPNISGATAVVPLIQDNLWELKDAFGNIITYVGEDRTTFFEQNVIFSKILSVGGAGSSVDIDPQSGIGSMDNVQIGDETPQDGHFLVLTTTGSVGIGTTAPGSKLTIVHDSGNGLSVVRGGKSWGVNANDSDANNLVSMDTSVGMDLLLRVGLGDTVMLKTNGNVGIGTVAPLSRLSINGGLHVGGDADAGDNNLWIDGSMLVGSGSAVAGLKHGTATLVAGTVTISDAATVETGTAATSSRIYVTRMTDGGVLGDSFSVTRVNATSFTLTSKTANATAASDTSTVSWLMINP